MFKETGKDAHVLAIFYLPVLNRKQVIATVRSQTLKMAETCILDLSYIYIYSSASTGEESILCDYLQRGAAGVLIAICPLEFAELSTAAWRLFSL